MYRFFSLFFVLLFSAIAIQGEAGSVKAHKPGPKEKCSVCGMFVAKYPDFLSQAVLHDGRVYFFDGPKEMFKFHLNPKRYLPSGGSPEVDAIVVTDYYEREPIDARKAWFVMGSDIRGPMGRELVPFEDEEDAREFMKDHHGIRILRFSDVNAAILRELE